MLLLCAGRFPRLAVLADPDGQRPGPGCLAPCGHAAADLAEEEQTTIAVFDNISPAVVHITNMAVRPDLFNLELLQIPQGTGTGFVWDQEGHVITNYHVVHGADAARVTLADHSSWKARLVGAYPDKDLAVLAINASRKRCTPFRWARRTTLRVGQNTFAIAIYSAWIRR